MQTLNLNKSHISPVALARIATILEEDGEIIVTNVAIFDSPGAAAFRLGEFMEKAVQAHKDGKF